MEAAESMESGLLLKYRIGFVTGEFLFEGGQSVADSLLDAGDFLAAGGWKNGGRRASGLLPVLAGTRGRARPMDPPGPRARHETEYLRALASAVAARLHPLRPARPVRPLLRPQFG